MINYFDQSPEVRGPSLPVCPVPAPFGSLALKTQLSAGEERALPAYQPHQLAACTCPVTSRVLTTLCPQDKPGGAPSPGPAPRCPPGLHSELRGGLPDPLLGLGAGVR